MQSNVTADAGSRKQTIVWMRNEQEAHSIHIHVGHDRDPAAPHCAELFQARPSESYSSLVPAARCQFYLSRRTGRNDVPDPPPIVSSLLQFVKRHRCAGLLLLSNDVEPHKAYLYVWQIREQRV
jgi:hypothetical protein